MGGERSRRPTTEPADAVGLSDLDAVARAREGDHDAFRVLVERYQGRVHRLAMRYLRDEDKAHDAAQEAFLKAYRALRRFEGRSSFYTWLYRLVVNQCLDLRRRDKSDRHVEWDEATERDTSSNVDPSAQSSFRSPAGELERAELRRQMAEAIDTLPDAARQTLLLREVDGLSYVEIARVLGIPKGTVMSRLHHARKRVQEALREMGIGPPGDSKRQEGER